MTHFSCAGRERPWKKESQVDLFGRETFLFILLKFVSIFSFFSFIYVPNRKISINYCFINAKHTRRERARWNASFSAESFSRARHRPAKDSCFRLCHFIGNSLVRLAINSLLLLPASRAEKAKAKKKKLLTQEIDRNLGAFGRAVRRWLVLALHLERFQFGLMSQDRPQVKLYRFRKAHGALFLLTS